jgi:hypothetical protein
LVTPAVGSGGQWRSSTKRFLMWSWKSKPIQYSHNT